MDNDLRKRVGRFRVDTEVIWSCNTGALFAIMGRCIIVKAEANYAGPYIEYLAYSADFEEIEEGLRAPMYEWQITTTDDKPPVIKAVRIPDTWDLVEKARTEIDLLTLGIKAHCEESCEKEECGDCRLRGLTEKTNNVG